MITILGIDPGSRITGYGVIATHANQHQFITCGTINVATEDLSERLRLIYAGITEVITRYQPQEVCIEEIFMHKNASSALKLGHARGVAMVAAANFILPIAQYSARQIKQCIVGYGAAEKSQMQHMVQRLLNIDAIPTSDAADALGIAICHAHMRRGLAQLINAQKKGAKA